MHRYGQVQKDGLE